MNTSVEMIELYMQMTKRATKGIIRRTSNEEYQTAIGRPSDCRIPHEASPDPLIQGTGNCEACLEGGPGVWIVAERERQRERERERVSKVV